jgi:hypothetical protein
VAFDQLRTSDDDEPAAIEAEFEGWHVWRATNRFGDPGDYVATLRDPSAGVDPTVMADTAERLRASLAEQRVLHSQYSRTVF